MKQGDRQIYQPQPIVKQAGERVVSTVCSVNCESRCRYYLHVKEGKIVRVSPGEIKGVPGWANVCLRGASLPFRAQSDDRVKYPMKRVGKRGEGKFQRISWDEAFDILEKQFKKIQSKYGPKSAGFIYMTGNQTKLAWESIERFSKCCGGTIFTLEALMSDHGASMGDELVYGKIRGGNDNRDFVHSKLLIFWGKNMGATYIQDMRFILEAKERGCKVITIDPRYSQSAAISDQWIPIRPATDTALALGMMNIIIANDLHDKEWLRQFSCASLLIDEASGQYFRRDGAYMVWDENTQTAVKKDSPAAAPALSGVFTVDGVRCRTAFDHLWAEVETYSLAKTAELTGIKPDVIEQLAFEYATTKPAAIVNSQGTQRIWNSFNVFRTTATLGAVCGNIGVSGGGVSHGVGWGEGGLGDGSGPKEDDPWDFYDWDENTPEANWQHGSQLYEQIESEQPYPIKLAWVATFNWLNQGPDANRVIQKVFPQLDFIVYVDPFMTWTSKYADLLLPCTSFFENWDVFVKPPWIFLQQPAIAPVGESRSDTQIFTVLAKRLGLEQYWRRTDEEWVYSFFDTPKMRARGFDWDTFVQEGQWAPDDANYVHPIDWENGEGYATPTGKFEFYTEKLAKVGHGVPKWTPPHDDPRGALGKKYPLVCIQFHDLYTIHSQHTPNSPIKVVRKEAWLEINPLDAEKRHIRHNDTVRVYNERGECKLKAFVTEGIIPGTVAIPNGWVPDYYVAGHLQNLTYLETNEIEEYYIDESNMTCYDLLVEIERA